MKKKILRLSLNENEVTRVYLMLGTGFFMGIFVAVYQVVADSLFLNRIGDQLDKAFLVAGLLGIMATALFSYLQNRIKFSSLVVTSILIIVLFTAFMYFSVHFGPESEMDRIVFVMYCSTGPMTAILLLSYWGIFGRLFDFRESKKIIGWIDTGTLIASILAFILIPLTSAWFPDTSNYLIVCALSIIGAAILLIVISSKFPLSRNDPREFEAEVRKETGLFRILKDRYVVLLSGFLVISMVTLIFTQYSFQELIKVQYPDQQALANFLAYFNAVVYGLGFLMQTFINDKILGNYGLKTSLFILPFVVGFFAIGSIVTGLVFGSSPEVAGASFVFFFLFVTLTRLFNWMIRDSLENPVYKLLFIPIDSKLRFGIQAKVEGVINESGRFLAGLIIFLFSLIPIFEIVWIPILLILLVVGYFLVSRNLYNGYRNKIRSKLETPDFQQEKLDLGLNAVTSRLEKQLTLKDSSKAVFSFKLLEKLSPSNAGKWLNVLMGNKTEETRNYAQRKVNEHKGLSVSDRYVIRTNGSGEEKNVLSRTELEQIIKSGGAITKTRIMNLTRSLKAEDRQYAAELMLHSPIEDNVSFLIELLNDPEPVVRSTAIKTSSKKFNEEVFFALVENLSNPAFSNQAMNALELIGGKALNYLESAFYRTGLPIQTLIKITRIMGRIGGQRAKDLLWNKIDFPDKVIVSQVLLSLGVSGFKASPAQATRIRFAIETDIGDVRWNLGAIQEVGDGPKAEDVKEAISREIQKDVQHIYMLLAMIYDTRSIQLVKENIESGTTEGTTYAVELLDIFLSEQLKQRVIPVLDDLSPSDKINRLEPFFPRSPLDEKLILKFLINRDFTQSNRWTKSCVLVLIGHSKIAEFKLDLIAHMFNPDKLLNEVAGWALHQISVEEYEANSLRLGPERKAELDHVILPGGDSLLMEFDKIKFFRELEVFKGVAGLALSYLADFALELRIIHNKTMHLDEHFNNYFYVLYSGRVDYYSKGKFIASFAKGQFIGEMLAPEGFASSHLLVAEEDSILLKINKDNFYELLADNVPLADKVLDYI